MPIVVLDSVSDVNLDRLGRLQQTVVGFGGFLGIY